jgi:serine/threonine protein kinase
MIPGIPPNSLYHPGQRLNHGRVVVRGLHATGGMSVVYRVDHRVGWQRYQPAVVKVAQPRTRDAHAMAVAEQRVAREAVLLRLVQHERVPRPLRAFVQDRRFHLAMELVPGWTLERLLADAGSPLRPPWPEPRVLALGCSLARLLADLHGAPTPLLVRDLKPSNLIVTSTGHVMLVDFGIACPMPRGEPVPASVRGLGTPGYAAPEQIAAEGWEDARTDLYALGVVLYRVATGHLPRHAATWLVGAGIHSCNASCSPAFARLVGTLLHVDPACRPDSAAEVTRTLERLRRK